MPSYSPSSFLSPGTLDPRLSRLGSSPPTLYPIFNGGLYRKWSLMSSPFLFNSIDNSLHRHLLLLSVTELFAREKPFQVRSLVLKKNINLLDMRAPLFVLFHFFQWWSKSSYSNFRTSENSAVVDYLQNQGGYNLFFSVKRCQSLFQIHFIIRHIPGHLYLLLGSLARSLAPVNTERKLHLGCCFLNICLHWSRPNFDLFAT